MRIFHWRINKVGVFMLALALFTLPALSSQIAYMVKDIYRGSYDSLDWLWPNSYVNRTIFFSAEDKKGYNLFISDGTPDGTEKVKAFSNSSYSYGPGWFTNVNGTVFFFIENSGGWEELWISDGTDAGTVSVHSFSSTFRPAKPTAVGNNLYFGGPGGLWRSDGMDTYLVAAFGSIGAMAEMDNILYFTATLQSPPYQYYRWLYRSDPETDDTDKVTEWVSGTWLGELINVDGILFFPAEIGGGITQLWKSDGTESGTEFVSEFSEGIRGLANADGTLFFLVDMGIPGTSLFQLWKSDGTQASTEQISPSGLHVRAYKNVNGAVFFAAADVEQEGSQQLWQSDGTPGGTSMIKDFYPGSLAYCGYMEGLNGTLFFPAKDAISGTELWKSDGTYGGTLMVKDIYPGPPDSYPGNFINANGTLFFPANDGTHGVELWSVKDIPFPISPIVEAFPDDVFKNKGSHKNTLTTVRDIDQLIADFDFAGAVIELQDLRKRVDGSETGSAADKNDWITDEAAQEELRELIDLLIAGLS